MTRTAAKTTEETLGAIVLQILAIREDLRHQGATAETMARSTAQLVRDRWPFTREWKYLCDDCGDTGWKEGVCRVKGQCGRPFKLPEQREDDYTGRGRCSPNHTFVTACHCLKGRSRHDQMFKIRPTDDFESAAKAPKKTFKRFGER